MGTSLSSDPLGYQQQQVPLLDSLVWMTQQTLMSPQRLQQQLRQRLKSPQQELQQQMRQIISSTAAKQLELNTRQEAQAFCISPRKRLTMQLRKISCCFSFITIQQLRYQVFCCLTILNTQQLWQQWMSFSHFIWLSSYYPQEPNKSIQPIPSFIWLLHSFEGLRLPKPMLILFQFLRENINIKSLQPPFAITL